MEAKHYFPSLTLAAAILLCISSTVDAARPLTDDEYTCVYTVYIRTSKTIKAGTDSIISLSLYGASGDDGIRINNLETWGGVMEEGHDYFERGDLDIFTGRGPCLDEPVCAMNLTSDGSGPHHGWYCNYVEVTTTGPHIPCHQELFTVEQWLALDRSPHQLTAERNYCSDKMKNNGTNGGNLLPVDVNVVPQIAFS